MNGVGGQQLAVGVARYKQNVMSFIDLIEWTRKYPVKDTGAPRRTIQVTRRADIAVECDMDYYALTRFILLIEFSYEI